MEPENKDKIVEHLKQIMLTHIESNERNSALSKKVLNRLILTVIMAASSVLIGVVIIISMLNVTKNKNTEVWQMLKEANQQINEQKKFIIEDRRDAAEARSQNIETSKNLNTMTARVDSLMNVMYKRAMK